MKKIYISVALVVLVLAGVLWLAFSDSPSAPITPGTAEIPTPNYSNPNGGGESNVPSEPGSTQPTTQPGSSYIPWFWDTTSSSDSDTRAPEAPLPAQATSPNAASSAFNTAIAAESDTVRARSAIVVNGYALVEWGDENVGGISLLMYGESDRWQIIDDTGGVPTIDWLLIHKVPYATAKKLIDQAGF